MALTAARKTKNRPSGHRLRSWRDVRRWEKHRQRWDLDRAQGLGNPRSPEGRRFWTRLAGRSLRPYNVGAIITSHYPSMAGWRSPGACRELLSIICLAHQLGSRGRVMVGSLERLAEATGLGRSTVQRALDDLVESGDVERRHHFEALPALEGLEGAGKVRHAQLECTYRPGPALRHRLRCAANGRTPEAVHGEQATRSQPASQVSKGVPGRAGGRATGRAPDGYIPPQVLKRLVRLHGLPAIERSARAPAAGKAPPSAPLRTSYATEVERRQLAAELGVETAIERRLGQLAAQGVEL